MKISFKNLGVIKEMDLDLSKKLIVFCGPNGTGKTYANYAVYGYIKPFLLRADMFIFKDLLENRSASKVLDYDKLYEMLSNYAIYSSSNINTLFGLQRADHFTDFLVQIKITKEDFTKRIREKEFSYSYSYENFTINYRKEKDLDILHVDVDKSEQLDLSRNLTMVEVYQNAVIAKYICFDSFLDVTILPVERSSIYTFVNELNINKGKINELDLPKEDKKDRYPKPIQDALDVATDLVQIKSKISQYAWLAEEIETTILHGKVLVSDDGELRFSPSDGVSLPIHLSASFIKNLSGLLIYLKHQAKENELLIIDEPEIGLHPDNQILLARIFARLINNGIRLLISTHSDYILRELNNLIMLSADNESISKRREIWGYKEDEKINRKDLGAYLFDFDKDDFDKVTVSCLPVDEMGFEVATIDNAICHINKISDEIYDALKYGEDA